jgi:2-hydroxychromene-2-carboxylate isomerase
LGDPLTVISYSIYHSANSYIGLILAERALQSLPIRLERRPIFVPKERGVKVADLQGRSESTALSSYQREDCARWAAKHRIELRFKEPGVFEEWVRRWAASPYGREELPARAYYAALGTGKEALLDRALSRMSYVDLLDVNEEAVIRAAAREAGLDTDRLMDEAKAEPAGLAADAALREYESAGCPGVPTWVVGGERFWGKDRVGWLHDRIVELLQQREGALTNG